MNVDLIVSIYLDRGSTPLGSIFQRCMTLRNLIKSTFAFHSKVDNSIKMSTKRVQKSELSLICTPFTGQTSKGGIYYALLI